MDLDESKKLSDKMDKKVLEKRKQDDEKENVFFKMINEKKDIEKVNEKIESGKYRKQRDILLGTQQHKGDAETEFKTNKGVSIIEEKFWNLVDDHKYKIDATSDGTCQVYAKTAALLSFKDPEIKISLAQEENKYLLENFEVYKESFSYPHTIKVGLGKNVTVNNMGEFKDFLKNNPEAPFMWGDQMQLQITANMQQVKINILKVTPSGKGNIHTIEPDIRLNTHNENTCKKEDIWLILKGEHYDTLVKKDNPLVSKDGNKMEEKEQTKEQEDLISEDEDDSNHKDKIIKKLKAELKVMKDGMIVLQTLYDGCEKEVKQLQEDQEKLKIEVKDHREVNKLEEANGEEESSKESDDEGSDHWRTVSNKQKSKNRRKNIKDKDIEIVCSICGQYVVTTNELKAHIMECHAQQYNCGDCDFQGTTKPILIKHMNFKHNSIESQEAGAFKCQDCNLEFSAEWNLNNHIRDEHKIKRKLCSFYKQSRCSFSAKSCWNSHDARESPEKQINKEENKCYSCSMVFNTRNGVMKHKKLKHVDEIKDCSKFLTGDCGFSDDYCWNRHASSKHIK